MEETDNFDQTLAWASEEEKLRATRTEGFNTFYLVIAAGLVALTVLLILIYGGSGKETINSPEALNMIQDPDNIYDIESEYEESGEVEPVIIEVQN